MQGEPKDRNVIDSRNIDDLKPRAQAKCRSQINACKDAGLDVMVTQTLRDKERQAYLYKKGRTIPGVECFCGKKANAVGTCPKHPLGLPVTFKDGVTSKSRHQDGLAWDLVPLDANRKPDWHNMKAFKRIADIAVGLGIRAGFYWKCVDAPHFEVR